MNGFAPSSWGRRMLTPNAWSRPAPSVPAAMIPGPAPVTTIQPASASRAARSRASTYTGSSGSVRAEPNIVIFRTDRYGRNTRNASVISASAASAILRSPTSVPSRARSQTTASIDRTSWACGSRQRMVADEHVERLADDLRVRGDARAAGPPRRRRPAPPPCPLPVLPGRRRVDQPPDLGPGHPGRRDVGAGPQLVDGPPLPVAGDREDGQPGPVDRRQRQRQAGVRVAAVRVLGRQPRARPGRPPASARRERATPCGRLSRGRDGSGRSPDRPAGRRSPPDRPPRSRPGHRARSASA